MERNIAIKCCIEEIINGKFYGGDKESLRSSYVLTKYGERISRVNIFGTVVDKFVSEDDSYASIIINDFSGAVRVKAFKEDVKKLKEIEVGNNVIVIGKPRFWNNEIYIGLEIIRVVEDPNFESYRRIEILKKLIERKRMISEILNLKEKLEEESFRNYIKERYGYSDDELDFLLQVKEERKDFKLQVLKIIKELDKGNGVDVLDIFGSINLESSILDSILTELLNEGKIYEIEPGKIKVKI